MHTSFLLPLLNQQRAVVNQTWANEAHTRARQVARYRRYAAGRWDAQMTEPMREMLRVQPDPDGHTGFGANYMRTVLNTMADRLHIVRFAPTAASIADENAAAWVADLLRNNHFDRLQLDVHEACLRDGDAFVMLEWDAAGQGVRISPQPAWDGDSGLLVAYARTDTRDLAVAVKLWRETHASYADTLRINLYWPDRVEKFTQQGAAPPQRIAREDWTTRDGQPLGVPLVAFSNRARGNTPYGVSELEDVIPLQDLLNRVLHSMSAASELAAFPIYVARGFEPPAGLTPGMILSIGTEGLGRDQVATFEKIAGSDTQPYIEQARFIIQQIYDTSHTPTFAAGANASGEALKQREVALLGKIRRFQVRAGDAWADVLHQAARIQAAFGAPPPHVPHMTPEWEAAAVRG